MIKKIVAFLTCMLPFTAQAAGESNSCAVSETTDYKALREAADKYFVLINEISQGKQFSEAEASKILTTDFKKVFNGQLFTQNRQTFLNDLYAVYANHGAWTVKPVEFIISPLDQTVVARLFIDMEKSGSYTAIAILRFNSDLLLLEINEVFNAVKGAYDF